MTTAHNVNYRELAREALTRAKQEIASENSDRLRYAALEIRRAMEAVTYSRAESYKGELPEDLYSTWQPRKVVEYLAEIDPRGTFRSSSFAIGVEDEPGRPAKVMTPMGTETRLTMKDLKDHYDALGSFLHIPTVDQLRRSKVADKTRLEKRCATCVSILDEVLKPGIFNSNIGQFTTIECQRCETSFKWRYDADATEPMRARCIKCNAIHLLTREDGRLKITPDWQIVKCPTADCDEQIGIWRDEMVPGRWWKCHHCEKGYALNLCFREVKPEEIAGSTK